MPPVLVLLLFAASPNVGIIHADVAVLRAKPADDARAVATLRINTRLDIEREEGTWLRVNVWSGHDGVRGVDGWLPASQVGRGDLKKDELLSRASDTTDAAEKIALLEKAVAIDGTDATTLTLLRDEYEAIGSPKTKAIDALLHDRGRAFVAACVEGSAVLLAERRANGSWKKWTGAYGLEDSDPEHELALTRARAKLKRELQASAWFAIFKGNAVAIEQTPFLAPKLTGDGSTGGHVARLVLGPCPRVHAATDHSMRPALIWTIPIVDVEEPAGATRWVRPLFGKRGAVYGIRAVDTRMGLRLGEDDYDYSSQYGFEIETVRDQKRVEQIEIVLWQVGC